MPRFRGTTAYCREKQKYRNLCSPSFSVYYSPE